MNIWRRIGIWLAEIWQAGQIYETYNTDALEDFEPKHFQADRKATARDHKQHDEAMDWAYFEYFE